MEFLSNIYDKVLSGYIFTDVFIYKDWPEKFLGKNINSKDDGNNKNENQENIKEHLEEVLGTFMKNGKISDSLWIKDKIFIGDEGIYILGEILTICQIVEFVDSEDIENVKSNEQFKQQIIEKMKRKIIKKRNSDMIEQRINSNIVICNSNTSEVQQDHDKNQDNINNCNNKNNGDNINNCNNKNNCDHINNCNDKNNCDNKSTYYNKNFRDNNYNNNDDSFYNYDTHEDNVSNQSIYKDNIKSKNKDVVSNFVEMLCEGKMNKYGFCEYDQNFNDRYHLNDSNADGKSTYPLEKCILPFAEDYCFKYVCLLLNNGGKREVRILRFNKDNINTNKLLDTLKGTVTFLNELRYLFKSFRSQVVLKNRINKEFCAYIKFHRGDPNFSGSKAVNEFFNSLNDKAVNSLFFGLNEEYLNLLEEAISYCPIATYAFYKNIKLLEKLNVNTTRRTWKCVCGLQKLYKNLKRAKNKFAVEQQKEVSNASFHNMSSIYKNNVIKNQGTFPSGNEKSTDMHIHSVDKGKYISLYKDISINNMEKKIPINNTSSNINSFYSVNKSHNSTPPGVIKVKNSNNVNNSNNTGNSQNLFSDDEHNYNSTYINNNKNNINSFDELSCNDDKISKSQDIHILNDTYLYVTSDEEGFEQGPKSMNNTNENKSHNNNKNNNNNNYSGNKQFCSSNRTIDDNNKTLIDEQHNTLFFHDDHCHNDNDNDDDDNYKTMDGYEEKYINENVIVRENSVDDLRVHMVKLFKTYGGQCRIGKVKGRCEDATFQTDVPPAFGIFDGVGSWSLEGIDASKFSIGLSLACQREAEKLSKNLNGYAKVSYNTITRSKLLLKNSLESVKKEYADAYGSSTAIVGILDEYTGKCGISSLGDSVCMILRREFLPGDINFERESYPKFAAESFLYYNVKGRNPSIIRKIIWKTTDQKWENGAPYQLSNLPDRSQWKDLENRGLHSFVKILEKVDIDGDSPDMALTPPSEILCMPGDLILLMSDGVSDNLFDEEIEAYCTFAISPEEACEFGEPALYTPAQDIAYSITNIAKRRSGDKLHCRPFFPFVGKQKDPNHIYKGNKVDDISCVAIWVVCENEESVKHIARYPNEPSILKTDKFYTNNYFQNFNKITDICTPTKTYIKEKNKIDRVNLQQVNVHSQRRLMQQQGYDPQDSSVNNLASHFSMNFFDSSETPIKFNTLDEGKYQDLSDIVLKDVDDEENDDHQEQDEQDKEYRDDDDHHDEDLYRYDEKTQNNKNFKNDMGYDDMKNSPKKSNQLDMSNMDSMKTPNSKNSKHTFKDKVFDTYNFDSTPRQRVSDEHLNEHIEKINNMYIKTPILYMDEEFKDNKDDNVKKNKNNKSKFNKKEEANILGLHNETPVKQMNTNKNKTPTNIISQKNIMNKFINNETPIKSFNNKETSLKVDKKITKSKRKSIFPSDKKDSPTKLGYTRKRSKKS
ncbi:hypothetical protein PFAG_03724 [Plasmodium falciparum Santa Lucia]|uniref:Protein phosphatase PPM11, putative n=8 Tax=Plasmodium falciparum TaxID=5833 RepID=Q8I5V9_PLAF7|nr:protein phosphatase PPM11, putative [Plasmodium falciparum 3D7]ETW35594.1 hypothetical protein PFTANZ_03722 [Plasmodium falciparum Tanzania (2000708)]ETW56127.1 hypothetical protein PFUGPA_01790 [Plasmodium falciparum Palo Alto/Uganda]ETW60381.1 hypothetical protein PFMC_03662 [Plasmodium falciparum CAMP/Malaysia]EUT82975.1 hypothetical protein PFAG_03724 [Plasmodium falciparum Santa Lucia]EWC75478.1 protein phosphatase [Plasmodium falciparum UGT5.1]EWC87507.1 hypothetical protein PFNF54_0|eukprot:XP_001350498.1 protein phosphatase, putative [Plasmodium falciparum 3D7]